MPDAGDVRRGLNRGLFMNIQRGLEGALAGAAARAEGDREKIRLERGQFGLRGLQPAHRLGRPGREKFKTEGRAELPLRFHVQ